MHLPYSRTPCHAADPSELGRVSIAHQSKGSLSAVVLLSFTGSLFPPSPGCVLLSEHDAGSLVVFPQQASLQQASLRTIRRHGRPRCGLPRNRPDVALPRDAGLNGCGIPRNSPSLLVQASVIEAGSRWTKSSQAGSSLSTTRGCCPFRAFAAPEPHSCWNGKSPAFASGSKAWTS